jgi:ubiquinone/menaquinone biosynthesis C-methylase UbiE
MVTEGSGAERTLATSFDAVADVYERGRPGYPEELLDELAGAIGLEPGRDVLDLAAGTGKLTRQLAGFGVRLVAVEPLAEMRTRCAVVVPGVPVVAATAEQLPFDAAEIDVVFVAQAYHWFDRERATAEVARVLRPGGHLVCLWNFEDVTVPWVAELEAIKDDVSRARRTLVGSSSWQFDLGAPDRFEEPATTTRSTMVHTADELLASFASRSYVSVLPPAERAAAVERVRAVIAAFDDPFPVPYRTEAAWWRRLGR